ncbi:hypothetical protein LI119_16860, partial [Erysipelatoclostridium ramosum]|nr:hypothetical protein [Thomasclavelia ramosa]
MERIKTIIAPYEHQISATQRRQYKIRKKKQFIAYASLVTGSTKHCYRLTAFTSLKQESFK